MALAVWRAAHMLCLIIGMSVAMLFGAELLYRGARGLKNVISHVSEKRPDNPLEKQAWYGGYSREAEDAQELVWKPYVYFRRKAPYRGQYINIDTLGRRVTPQAAPVGRVRRVFFFGGSTVWGWFQRDAYTIPAITAQRLRAMQDSIGSVEVTNFGETGYVFTQEVLELLLQLRAGNVPDVVVFYDGINDVASTLQAREGGLPQNESKRVSEFAFGRQLDRARYNYVFSKDMKAIGRLAVEGLEHLAIVQRLHTIAIRNPPPLFSTDSAAAATASMYEGNVRIVEALAKEWGFEAIFMWQPTLYTTKKKVTPFEAYMVNSIHTDSVQARLAEVHAIVPVRLDSTIKTLVGSRFIDGVGLFTGATFDVYADRSGHATEEAVPTIVDAFFPAVREALMRKRPTRGNLSRGRGRWRPGSSSADSS